MHTHTCKPHAASIEKEINAFSLRNKQHPVLIENFLKIKKKNGPPLKTPLSILLQGDKDLPRYTALLPGRHSCATGRLMGRSASQERKERLRHPLGFYLPRFFWKQPGTKRNLGGVHSSQLADDCCALRSDALQVHLVAHHEIRR